MDACCDCEHEAGDYMCVCMKPKEEAKKLCPDCQQGLHSTIFSPRGDLP